MVFLRRFTRLLACLLLAVLPILNLGTQSAYAQSGGQGLEISPPSVELNLDPGKSATTTIKLRNVTSGTLLVKSAVNDFVAEGEDGVAKPLLDNSQQSTFPLAQYVAGIADQKIAAGEQKSITVSIAIPADASPGGHYGIVRFTGTPETQNGTGVAISASIGELVLVRVSGDVKQDLSVAEFSVNHNGKQSALFETGPINVVERLKNAGNIHLKPQGDVRITNLFGQEVAKLSVNDNGGNVLPSSIRKFDQTFSKKILFGRYTANLNVHYDGETGCLLTQSVTFWVIPYKLVGIALILILVLMMLVQLLRHRSHHKDIGSSLDNTSGGPGPFDEDEHDQIPPSIPTNPQL